MKKIQSEFGKGCAYNLGLFLAHEFQFRELLKEKKDELKKIYAGCFFNASSDHLYELQIPDKFPEKLKTRIKKFRSKCLNLGHGNLMMEATINSVNRGERELSNALDIINPRLAEWEAIQKRIDSL